MHLQLRTSRPEDVPHMVETYFDAFSEDEISRRFSPRGTKSAYDFWTSSLSDEVLSEHSHFLSVWDTSTTFETFVGFAKWVVPGAPSEPLPKLEDWPQEGDPEFAAEFFACLEEMHSNAMGERPHWYLEMLAVKKQFQGKGAASLMLKYGVAKADEDGVESYLDASPLAKPIYERYGFRVVHTETFLNGRYSECAMLRDAMGGN
ncbi:hypothetical protein PT974_04740 [Cladobotryum mycophilum]|uniref:N-acetyltransferase domain-containing protein n=1 Tax=Cladobotryum mycophilum TaxID=491253 RepID=A0ABR0SQ67_9HYPO